MTTGSHSTSGAGRGSHTTQDSSASTDKPHPSEFLEFATISAGPNRSSYETYASKPNTTVKSELALTNTNGEATRSNDDLFAGLSAAVPGLRRLSVDARNAAEAERKMTFWRGCKLYPKAIAWSMLLSTTIIMEGYDKTLISSFFAFPVFRRNYGTPVFPDNPRGSRNYQISPQYQTALTSSAVAGEVLGLLMSGFFTDRVGYHKTMIAALVWMSLFVFVAFFAVNINMLLASQILCGLPWGVFQTLSTTYAAEVMPVQLRAYLLSNVNMCWLIGQILGVSIIRALVHNTSEWAYRIPFGLQWAFAVPILIGVAFAPESPWWLIRHEKIEQAKKALLRLTSRRSGDEDMKFDVDESISMMRHTNEVEKYLQDGGMSYKDCFTGTDLRRTEIACMVWATQALCGSTLTGYAAYFYEVAGFDTANSFNLSVGMYGLAIIGGIISWFLLPKLGRRTLYLWGLIGSLTVLLVAGGISTMPLSPTQSWTIGSLVIFLTFIYDMTIGPVCYVLVAEIPSTRLRVKTVVLARVCYNLVSILINIATPRFLNPTALNWRGKACFFFAGTCAICLVWAWFRLPEPMGLSYLELDILFEKKAKARQFRRFRVNLARTGYFSLVRREEGIGGRSGSVWQGY